MGCCVSSRPHRSGEEAEPPPAEEVETVKEVLMETVPVVQKGGGDEGMKGMSEVDLGRTMPDDAPSTAEIRCHLDNRNPEIEIVSVSEVVSEVSEICSYSESYSTATAPEAERKDDEDEDGVVNQRPPVKKRRLPGGGRGRGQGMGKGKGRRPIAAAAVAPEKRGQVTPLRPLRGRSTPVAGQAHQTRNAVQLENERRGEGSGRGGGGEGYEPRGRELGVGQNDVVGVEEAESLENPIVSLECFIFL